MPRTSATGALLFSVALLIFGSAAGAQTPTPAPTPTHAASPVPSPASTASATPAATPSPSPTPFKLITLGGSVDAGFTSIGDADAARFTNGVPSHVFDASTGPFFDENGGRILAPANDFDKALDLQNANVQLLLNGSVVSAKFEGSFGTDADVVASNGQSRSGSNLTQAYVQLVEGPVTFLAGKFSSLAGEEVIEAPGNTQYSRSYLFGYAVPFTHTGVRATYAYNSKVSLVVGVNNGWDDWKFAGKKKTIEAALLLAPSPGYSLNLQTYNGNDFAANGNSATLLAPLLTNRMLYDGVLTVHATSVVTLNANYDNGAQLGAVTDPLGVAQTAHWNGIAGYLTYQFRPQYALSLRKETFHDAQGFRTGIAQRLQSNTATLDYTPGSNFIFRAEYRLDTSDGNNFAYRGSTPLTGGRPHQSSLGLETIVKFP